MNRGLIASGIKWLPVCLLLLAVTALGACTSQRETELSALHHFTRGNESFLNEDYPSAIHHYRVALEMDDRAADVYYNLGLAYYHIQEYEMSVEALENALTIDPKRAEFHYNLALAYHKNYDLQAANRHYNLYRKMAIGETAQDKPQPVRQAGVGADPQLSAAQAAAVQRPEPLRQARNTPRPRNNGADATANPFQGSEKWWTEDIPTR